MNSSNESKSVAITACLVADRARLSCLPRHFGRRAMRVESVVYDAMREVCLDYQGGYWQFWELSNGGFFMTPEMNLPTLRMRVDGNGYEGTMTPKAAGITACLFAFSRLSFEVEAITTYFHRLRQFALDHPEACEIFRAID